MTTKEIIEERERIQADLYDLENEYLKKRDAIKDRLRSLQRTCPHDNVSHNGGGYWCKDCDYTR